jgi:hypothetical protein
MKSILISILFGIFISLIIIYFTNNQEKYKNINPGFANQINESVKEWNPDMINPTNWNDSSFSSLVSNLEDRQDMPAIRSIL